MKFLRYSILVVLIVIMAISVLACEDNSEQSVQKITFATNGGEEVEDFHGEVIHDFPNIEREGYYLEGWYETEDFSSSQVSFPYEVMENTELFARWFTAEEGSPYITYSLDEEKDEYIVTGYTGKSRLVVIPELYQEKPVSAVADGAFNICDTVNRIIISASVENIGRAFYRTSMLYEFEVNSNSENFSAEDGILYDYDKTTLISYPPAKEGSSFTIPESVSTLANSAFRFCRFLNDVTITNNI